MIFLDTSLGSKNPSKNRPRHRGPPQFKNTCGHKCSPGVENKCLRRCKTMEKQRHGKLLSRTCRNNRTSCYFSPGDLKMLPTKRPPFWGPENGPQNGGRLSAKFLPSGENSASFDCFRRYATEVLHTAGPLGSHGFAAPRAIVLHALRTFMPTPVLELGRPTLATLESTAFLALGFGAVNGQDFPTRRDPLGRFTLFLISQLVSGSRVSLTQGRAGPAGVETAGREHGSCNHAVGE